MSDDVHNTLLRIEQLNRAMLRATIGPKLSEIRRDKTLKRIYELTGDASVTEVARAAKVSTGKVSGIWQSWEEAGIVTKIGRSYLKL
jgi:hypothetical protein